MGEPDPLQVAVEAAREAGALALGAFRGRLEISSKGGSDIVTQIDTASEAAICARLAAAFPGDAILAEERGRQGGDAAFGWVIDPLDGTHNYAAQLPFWCVSIARVDQATGRPEIGVVYDPLHDELFAAWRGGGATLNGIALRIGGATDLRQALLACDIGYTAAISTRMMRAAVAMQPQARRLRILGSAVLALAYVAAGRVDAFFHLQLQPWDLAAVWLILAEAGGTLTTWSGRALTLSDHDVVAANPTLQPQVLALLQRLAPADEGSGIGDQGSGTA